MSVEWTTWVWNHSPYSGARFTLHLALADTANDDGLAWPSARWLAAKSRMNENYVREIIRSFEQEGLIHIERRTGHASRYWLLAPPDMPRVTPQPRGNEH